MKVRVVYTTEEEKTIAIANNAGLRICEEEDHSAGQDDQGQDIREKAVVFTDEPVGLSDKEKLEDLQGRVKALEDAQV